MRQEVVAFSHETTPVSLGIVVDLSGSMRDKIAKVRAAVEALLKNIESEDEEFLVTFGDHAELRWPFTTDKSELRASLSFVKARGSTALFDAVALAVHQMREARNRRRVLFLISDGGENHSRLIESELRRLLDEGDVQIHAIGIHDNANSLEEAMGPWILQDLATRTGGQHHIVGAIGELPALAARMSEALHDQYLLGYQPAPMGPSGSFRRIDVKLAVPRRRKLDLYSRRRYRVP
jgi:Ca-activated chloride channel family protein